jgi:hypothetical protein
MLVRGMASKGLQPLGKVVGIEVFPELPVAVVVVAPDSNLLERPIYSLDLAVGPRVVGLVKRCSMPCWRQIRSNLCSR